MLMHTGGRVVTSGQNLISTVACRLGGETEYALEGSVFSAGATVQWLRDGLGIIRSSGEVEALAASVSDNGGVYLVPAFTGLGAPHWDPYARGAILGITRGTTAGHLARATLESIAFQTADLLAAMANDSGTPLAELRVDGGATDNDLLMQFQADLLGVPVVRPQVRETTALGAAYLAGLAIGYWRDRAEIGRFWQAERTFTPAMARSQAAELRYYWSRALERAKGWIEP
jgi:glycerol kinase